MVSDGSHPDINALCKQAVHISGSSGLFLPYKTDALKGTVKEVPVIGKKQ